MIKRIVVKRYAEAFLAFAEETIGPEKAAGEVADLRAVMDENPGFIELLRGFEISQPEKEEFIDRVLGEAFSPELREFLKLVLKHGHIDKLPMVAEAVRAAYLAGRETDVMVRSAFPLDTAIVNTINEGLKRRFKTKVKMYLDLDDSLIGGIQVIVGNRILDGSIRKSLDELKDKLKAARI